MTLAGSTGNIPVTLQNTSNKTLTVVVVAKTSGRIRAVGNPGGMTVKLAPREPDSASSQALLAFARSSGRRFSSFMDELFWAEKELKQVLRNRSGHINLHTEDISRFTDDWQVVYSHCVAVAEEL